MYISAQISDGLGNRFFQVAAMLGAAGPTARKPVFVREWIQDTCHAGPKTILDYFPDIMVLDRRPSGEPWSRVEQPFELGFTYVPLQLPPHGCVQLRGTFQTEAYFPSTGIPRPAILKDAVLEARYASCVFLHVRRGDYLRPECGHHYVDLTNYYRYALALCSDRADRIVVCSDDIEWCRRTLPARYGDLVAAGRWEFFEGSDYDTLRVMTACGRGGICANSTFSWWGAYWGVGRRCGGVYTMPHKWGHSPPLPPVVDLHPAWAVVLPT